MYGLLRVSEVFKTGAQLVGGGVGALPLLFLENWKMCPNLGEKIPWLSLSMGKISHLKENFWQFPVEKIRNFFPAGLFLFVLQVNVYQSALIPRRLPCPKKFLVMRLQNPQRNQLNKQLGHINRDKLVKEESVTKNRRKVLPKEAKFFQRFTSK